MNVPAYDVIRANASYRSRLIANLGRVLDSGQLILGPCLQSFEQDFARHCGVSDCVGVGTGLDALAFALQASGVGPGDEVIVPAFTFAATWFAASQLGGKPVPVDVRWEHGRFEPDLFNTIEYADLHAHRYSMEGLRCIYRRANQDAVAGVFQAVQCQCSVFASPGRGPYGGFDLSPELTGDEIVEFVSRTEIALRENGARRINVTLPPFCYSPSLGPRILAVLCRAGYIVTRQELNQALALEPGGPTSYRNHGARKRLNNACRAGVTVRMLAPDEHRAGYDAIVAHRRKKSRELSMSWHDVQAMATVFPTKLHFFGAEQGSQLLAAAICVAVSARVLYVYAWGEISGAEALSPVCVLADHLSNFARSHGFELLDLGTSSVDDIVNPGLLAFKRSLGADSSLKLWLTKVLA